MGFFPSPTPRQELICTVHYSGNEPVFQWGCCGRGCLANHHQCQVQEPTLDLDPGRPACLPAHVVSNPRFLACACFACFFAAAVEPGRLSDRWFCKLLSPVLVLPVSLSRLVDFAVWISQQRCLVSRPPRLDRPPHVANHRGVEPPPDLPNLNCSATVVRSTSRYRVQVILGA